jgi:hypothetical protein
LSAISCSSGWLLKFAKIAKIYWPGIWAFAASHIFTPGNEMVNKSALFLLLILLGAGCLDEPDCYQLNNHIIGISFKKLADSSADTVELLAMGTLEPPLLFAADTALSKIYLPLNYFQDETDYVFESPDSVRLLRLTYLSQAQFVSEDCGEKFVLSALRIKEHNFDSVRLVVDTPTRDGSVINIEIFQ